MMGFFIMTKEEMIAKFKIWYPQFADKPELIISMAYDFADKRIKESVWTNLYEEGFMALMAHTIYMRTGGKDGNPIDTIPLTATSKSVGKLSIGYTDQGAAKYIDAGEFALSIYGRLYWDLRSMVKPTGRVF